jgi:rhamnopyranosyl-N-acetylglucosaminyl-diphospho-decaprenol beta-1,3/1,4-galactofuranosyltransferase
MSQINYETQSVVAIIVTFNRPELLCESVVSLLRQTHPITHILIVDNASTPEASKKLHAAGLLPNPKIEVLRLSKNLGGAGGFAAGIQHALDKGCDWCWLMDDDVSVEEGCLENLLRFSRVNVLMPARISTPFENCHLPALSLDFRSPFQSYRKRRKLFSFRDGSLQGALPSYEVEDIAFEGALIRCDVIRRAGLPRADFFIAYDDSEYACRLRYKLREKILFVPAARIQRKSPYQESGPRFTLKHDRSPSWRAYYTTRNMVLLLKLYGENRAVISAPLLYELGKLMFRFCRGEFNAAIAAFWGIADGLREKTPFRFLPGGESDACPTDKARLRASTARVLAQRTR